MGWWLHPFKRDYIFKLFLNPTITAELVPVLCVCRAVVDIYANLFGMLVTNRPIARLSIPDGVVTQVV